MFNWHQILQKHFYFLIKCLLIFQIGLSPLNSKTEEGEVKVVDVEKASLANISQTVRLIGTVKAKKSTILTAKINGTLDYLLHSGERVAKGGLIAKLENADLEKAWILSKEAAKIAKDRHKRTLLLSKSNTVSKQTAEERKNKWIEAEKTLSEAKIELEKTHFIAPFDGIVGAYKKREGAQVEEGDQIVAFYDPSDVIVEFDIPLSLLKDLQNPATVMIESRSFPLLNIQKMVDPDSHMLPAHVDFLCDHCLIGENVDIDLLVAEHKKVIVVPLEAVFLRNGNPFVYLVKNNKAVLSSVTLGLQEKDKIEITSGVKVGDLVITQGNNRLHPEENVKINKEK